MAMLPQVLGQDKVTTEWFEHMLPRARRFRVANDYRLAFFDSMQNVGNETIFCPVTAADHVAGTRRSQSWRVISFEE
ncbi:hypothetical protein D9M71_781770 [compost metagenome]